MGERIKLVKRAFAGKAVERIPVMAHNFLMAEEWESDPEGV